MKKLLLIMSILIFSIMSCNLFKPTIGPARFIYEMREFNKSDNPAFKELIKKKLLNSMLDIKSVKVHSIAHYPNPPYLWYQWESTISSFLFLGGPKYHFCIRSTEVTKDFTIKYRFFSNDIDTISELKNYESIVDIKGEIHKIRGIDSMNLIIIEVLENSIKIKRRIKK